MEPERKVQLAKLAPKLLGPYKVLSQHKNDIKCVHPVLHTQPTLHSSRVIPFFGTQNDAHKIALLDEDEFVVEDILQHNGQWDKMKDIVVRYTTHTPIRRSPRLLLRSSSEFYRTLRRSLVSRTTTHHTPISFNIRLLQV